MFVFTLTQDLFKVMQLMETMDQLLEEAGCTTDQIQQVSFF